MWFLIAVALWSEASAAPVTNQSASVRFGADERIRHEAYDHIPISADPPGYARGYNDNTDFLNNFLRFRTRVWMEVDPLPDVIVRARLVDEFRIWERPSAAGRANTSTYIFPDEGVFDSLYLELRNLLDNKLELRLGRQDLIYGTGKVIFEGTPKDGSRTLYFNAAKAVWKGLPDTIVDVAAIWNPPEDALAINSTHRNLTGFTKYNDDVTESGAFIYAKNHTWLDLPFESYLIYKNESAYDVPAQSSTVAVAAADIGTVGVRLIPRFSSWAEGNLESAWQFGKRGGDNICAFMVDAGMFHPLSPQSSAKPTADYGLYFLSGDNPNTTTVEGWDPLWARYPQYSELYLLAFDADGIARWSNLMMPHAGFSAFPVHWLKTSAMVGWLMAPENNGPGSGNTRGWLEVVKGEFVIGKNLWLPNDKLSGHLWFELFQPGDYYSVGDSGWFARWEVGYAF
ncbi:MAG: hypothetical protein WCL16_07715 [bacterium]